MYGIVPSILWVVPAHCWPPWARIAQHGYGTPGQGMESLSYVLSAVTNYPAVYIYRKVALTLSAGHADAVYSLAWSTDGDAIATGGADRTVGCFPP